MVDRRIIRKALRDFTPHRARHRSYRDQFGFALLGLVTIYEGLVCALSLGTYSVDARAWVLFEGWLSDEGENNV